MVGELILHCGFALTTALCGKVSVSYDSSHEPHYGSDKKKKSSQYFVFNSHSRTHLSTARPNKATLIKVLPKHFFVTFQNEIVASLQSLLSISGNEHFFILEKVYNLPKTP